MTISQMLNGKKVVDVMSNGRVLMIRCEDGVELTIAWLNDNGEPVNGTPRLVTHGYRLVAPMKSIIELTGRG